MSIAISIIHVKIAGRFDEQLTHGHPMGPKSTGKCILRLGIEDLLAENPRGTLHACRLTYLPYDKDFKGHWVKPKSKIWNQSITPTFWKDGSLWSYVKYVEDAKLGLAVFTFIFKGNYWKLLPLLANLTFLFSVGKARFRSHLDEGLNFLTVWNGKVDSGDLLLAVDRGMRDGSFTG